MQLFFLQVNESKHLPTSARHPARPQVIYYIISKETRDVVLNRLAAHRALWIWPSHNHLRTLLAATFVDTAQQQHTNYKFTFPVLCTELGDCTHNRCGNAGARLIYLFKS